MAIAERIVGVGQKLNTEAIQKELTLAFGENNRELAMAQLRTLGVDLPEERVFCDPHLHEGSQAIYIADFYAGKNRVLISYLRPNSHTSIHHHEKPIIEEYYSLAGALYLNGEMIPKEGLVVWPSGRRRKTVHTAIAGNEGALTLIVMRNAKKVPAKRQHIRLPEETERKFRERFRFKAA